MLSADQITALQDSAQAFVEPVVEWLISDIAERIAAAGQFTSTASYEIWRAQNLGLSLEDIKKQLQKKLNVTASELEQLLRQAAEVGYNFDLSRLPTANAIPFAENTSLQQIVDAAVRMVGEDLTNLTRTAGFVCPDGKPRPLYDAYRNACDFAFQKTVTGTQDYISAIRDATRGLAEKGVISIEYNSGKRYTLEAAVRRSVVGGMGLIVEEVNRQNFDTLGCDGWEISAHSASAPDHEPIQGKQYPDAEYQRLNNSLKRCIGTLNCGHGAFPIILGVNSPQYTPAELEEMRQENEKGVTYGGKHYTLYEATQVQRKLERAIRRQKHRILVDEATGDTDKLQTDQIRYQVLTQEYKRFSKATGQRMQYERMEVAGFGPKQANAAAKEYDKKALANSVGNSTIGLYRRDRNPGAFASLPERMSKKHIREVAKEFGVDLKGLSLNIDMNEDLLRIPITGRADSEHIGGITFFPNAFTSKENLLRTIYHEKVHVQQFREFGAEYVQNNVTYFEHLAYAAEDEFISQLKERGAI